MTYQLTHFELIDHLKRQLRFLSRYSADFDEGFTETAVTLGAVLRILLHDTRSSTSLLGLLKVLDSLQFIDTATPFNPANILPTMGLVRMTLQAGPTTSVECVAPLGDPSPARVQKPKAFEDWWNTPVTKDSHGSLFSRRDYVLTLANKEGGAHVDPEVKRSWYELHRNNSLGWVLKSTAGDLPLDSPAPASLDRSRTR
jgi:hypothetical protein